jgi:uracil-DNA glycosylase
MYINTITDQGWLNELLPEVEKPYFIKLREFLDQEIQDNLVFPETHQIFNAFNLTPFDKVKVVIVGQDPYHGPGQAHGLCFSVPAGVAKPPSLRNIFKELCNDLQIPVSTNGDLTKWSQQGVLLLNAALTVRASQAGSHQKQGWEVFTDRVITLLSEKKNSLVFFLWGNYAQSKTQLIDQNKHLILKSVHPSPLSASRGFFGCSHFSKANEFLKQNDLTPINWDINN